MLSLKLSFRLFLAFQLITNITLRAFTSFRKYFWIFPFFSSFILRKASLLFAINNRTTEQHGLEQHQLVSLFTRVEWAQTKVRVALIFDESGKVVRRTHGNELPRENGLEHVTIHHPTIGRVNASTVYLYKLSGQEDPSHWLEYIVSAGVHLRQSKISSQERRSKYTEPELPCWGECRLHWSGGESGLRLK